MICSSVFDVNSVFFVTNEYAGDTFTRFRAEASRFSQYGDWFGASRSTRQLIREFVHGAERNIWFLPFYPKYPILKNT